MMVEFLRNVAIDVGVRFRVRRNSFLARRLSKLTENSLESVYRQARDLQHREEDGWFRNEETYEWQRCRMASTEWDDPIMEESGCAGEFANDFRKKDLRDGCPFCTGDVVENSSEPDVMARWGFR